LPVGLSDYNYKIISEVNSEDISGEDIKVNIPEVILDAPCRYNNLPYLFIWILAYLSTSFELKQCIKLLNPGPAGKLNV
jgi:hypothetical protein